ncbi:uncharacterized protein [Clytia hemisphaerica]|uniref:Uncharacterized protein n=1 Tax=Clytia hemisphaerica TaxID=252671 RepID=A0A7M5XEQ6_9CNID
MVESTKIFVLPCKTLEREVHALFDQDRRVRSLLSSQEKNKKEWKNRFAKMKVIINSSPEPRLVTLEPRVSRFSNSSQQSLGSTTQTTASFSRYTNESAEPRLMSPENKPKFSRHMNGLEPKKVPSSKSLHHGKVPSEKRMQTASLQYPESSGMPKVQSEASIEVKHLKYAKMEARAHWSSKVVFKECLEFCTPELQVELRKIDPEISDKNLDKTMSRFMQFDSVRRSLTEAERITNSMNPGLMTGERVKHYRNLMNSYLEERGLSDEHRPVKEVGVNDTCKKFHEMDNKDKEILDKLQNNLKKKKEAKAEAEKAKKDVMSDRKEVLPHLPIQYSVHPEPYDDKVNKAVAQVNASVAKATVHVPRTTPKERKSAFYNLSKKFDANLRRQHEKKKAEREKQTGPFIGNRTIVPVPKHRRYEASTMTLDERRENAEELMHKFSHDIVNAPSIDVGAGHIESADTYCKFLIDNAYDYGVPPCYVEEPRIRRKIEEGSYPNWTVKEEELSTVLRFAWKGKLKKLRQVLKDEKFQKKINRVDKQQRTAVHYAASWGCIKTLNILLRCPGVDVNKRDSHGKTPLYKAVEIGSLECVKALIKAGADTRIKAHDSRDALTYLLHFHGDERFEMFKLLWDVSPRTNDESRLGEMTILHMALMSDKHIVLLKCIDYMLCQGIDVNAREGNGRTAAHIAVIDQREDILQLLMAHKMNPLYEDLGNKSVIDYVRQPSDSRIYDVLQNYLEYGPGDIAEASNLRDGKNKHNMRRTEDYRTKYFGHRFL